MAYIFIQAYRLYSHLLTLFPCHFPPKTYEAYANALTLMPHIQYPRSSALSCEQVHTLRNFRHPGKRTQTRSHSRDRLPQITCSNRENFQSYQVVRITHNRRSCTSNQETVPWYYHTHKRNAAEVRAWLSVPYHTRTVYRRS